MATVFWRPEGGSVSQWAANRPACRTANVLAYSLGRSKSVPKSRVGDAPSHPCDYHGKLPLHEKLSEQAAEVA